MYQIFNAHSLHVHYIVRDGTLLGRLSPGLAHGKIITNNMFGGVEWHPDETTLLYVAQTKDEPGKSFFDEKQRNDDADVCGCVQI